MGRTLSGRFGWLYLVLSYLLHQKPVFMGLHGEAFGTQLAEEGFQKLEQDRKPNISSGHRTLADIASSHLLFHFQHADTAFPFTAWGGQHMPPVSINGGDMKLAQKAQHPHKPRWGEAVKPTGRWLRGETQGAAPTGCGGGGREV